MYIDRDFSGNADPTIRNIINAGRLAVVFIGGNWDYFEKDGNYYYIAKKAGARSGWFGDSLYFKQWTRRNAEKLYFLSASVDAVNIDFECLMYSDGEPGFWDCNDLAADHGCDFWSIDKMSMDQVL